MLFWNNANTVSNAIWATVESITLIAVPVFYITKQFRKMDKRLDRIEYAIYNDGKTGLVNKVDDLLENQQAIRIDVEVLKANKD